MKKIISISFIALISCLTLTAQQSFTPIPLTGGEKVKVMSTQEANALNGKAEPTINGMPYSQYKAQQEALKQKQSVENKSVTARASLPVVSKEQPAPAVVADKKTVPADKQPYADKTIPGTLLTPPAVHMGSADAPKAATEIQAPAVAVPVKTGNK
ncbi:MAG: hypothetical protein IPI54_00895 [Chitinophagaceae bacterium]|nr:hypothetical protein [Chitinophagaceae bacterium]